MDDHNEGWQVGQRVRVHCGHGLVVVGTISRTHKGDAKVEIDGGGHLWQGARRMEQL